MDNRNLAKVLISSGGDVRTVVEVFNRDKPVDDHVTYQQLIEAFMESMSDVTMQDSIKAMMLFNLLQILDHTKDQLIAGIADFSPGELTNTIKLVIEGITQLLPAPVQPANNGQAINILNLSSDAARDRIQQRLDVYKSLNIDGNSD